MRTWVRRSVAAWLAGLLAAGSLGCSSVGDQVNELRSGARDLSERARFCLAVARAAGAVESGSPRTALESAEEVVAQAPDDLAARAEQVLAAVETAMDGDDTALRDPALRTAIAELRDATVERCDPR